MSYVTADKELPHHGSMKVEWNAHVNYTVGAGEAGPPGDRKAKKT